MSENEEPEVRVRDRRRFTAEGDIKPGGVSDGVSDAADATDAPETAGATSAQAEEPAAAMAPEPPAAPAPPLPPANFEILILSLVMQAEMELRPDGDPSRPPDVALAKHSIDLLGVLAEKTKGNLTLEEQRLLENSLTELRFRYVQRVGEINSQANQAKGSSDSNG